MNGECLVDNLSLLIGFLWFLVTLGNINALNNNLELSRESANYLPGASLILPRDHFYIVSFFDFHVSVACECNELGILTPCGIKNSTVSGIFVIFIFVGVNIMFIFSIPRG